MFCIISETCLKSGNTQKWHDLYWYMKNVTLDFFFKDGNGKDVTLFLFGKKLTLYIMSWLCVKKDMNVLEKIKSD